MLWITYSQRNTPQGQKAYELPGGSWETLSNQQGKERNGGIKVGGGDWLMRYSYTNGAAGEKLSKRSGILKP